MFEIKIDDKAVMSMLDRMAATAHNMSPVMSMIAQELERQTEKNFASEGRPKWLGLKPSTIAMRTKRGTWPGMMLQVSAGGLSSSIGSSHDAMSATVGSNKKYAAMQQLGGVTSPRSMIPNKVIAARPFLPIDAQGNLQAEASENILGLVGDYLRRVAG
ncbi:MAG: phage virion morphogenesis protein [Sulfurimicrobium sp.]|nr:phage virion morphogenesis protein [Gallionella sp.]MDP1898282.1 phage virion morphogenesis protein [Sulfurimicrobium sp.]